MLHDVYIALGGNIGDTRAAFKVALESLDKSGVHVRQISDIIATKPYGYTDQPDFLNAALYAQTNLSPQELLKVLKKIETDIGRVPTVRWGERLIDLDIIFYDDIILQTENLTIPHNDMHNREFVLQPLLDINPALRHPLLHKTVRELYDKLIQSNKN